MTAKAEYTQMVADLAKNGQDVINDMTTYTAHILHMAVGLSGEVTAELTAAIANDDRTNLIEECGDVEFYLEGLVMHLPVVKAPLHALALRYPQFPLHHLQADKPLNMGMVMPVIQLSGEILDLAKKGAMYAKPLDEVMIAEYAALIRGWLNAFYAAHGLTQEQVRQANMHKLLKGKNARYASGTFSNKQAQERADKQGQDDA